MRGRLIADESSLQMMAINIRMKGPGVSSRHSRVEIPLLNSRGSRMVAPIAVEKPKRLFVAHVRWRRVELQRVVILQVFPSRSNP